jgi:CBS domain-containing protein
VNALYENIPIAHICQIVGEVNTAITKRAIELSVLKWKRSLLSDLHKYRSQGRKEQLLLTDQDNAGFSRCSCEEA